MTTKTRPNLNATRNAYMEAAKFERWVRKTLLPAMNGKVRYGEKGSQQFRPTYFYDRTDDITIKGRRAGIDITVRNSENAYRYEYLKRGTVHLTWDEIDALTGPSA